MLTRKIIFSILNNFDLFNEKIPILLNQSFKKASNISKKDKNRVRVCVNEVIRYRGLIDYLIENASKRKIYKINIKIRNILRLGIYELVFDDMVPDYAAVHSCVELAKKNINKRSSSMVNAVMRNIQNVNKEGKRWKKSLINDKIELAYPAWLVKRWKKKFGEYEAKKLCAFLLKPKNMYVRLAKNNIDKNKITKLLKKDNIKVIQHEKFNHFFQVTSGQQNILDNDLFKRGLISIQDPGSGAIVELVNPQKKENILDVCAAPGTKSLFMAQRVGKDGKIFACDKSKKRIDKAKNDERRHNLHNIDWHLLDASKDKYPFFKKILIDVPCSGTGVIGRRPDIKWRLKKNDIKRMSNIQKKILENISNYLKPGGKIIYSTCSLESEENEDIIRNFLKNRPDFKMIVADSFLPNGWVNFEGFMFAFPTKTNTDGLFAAVLQRKF